MRENYICFESFLAGTGNEFIGRGALKSGTATHILHLKQLKNPGDILRSRFERDVHFVTICRWRLFSRGRSL